MKYFISDLHFNHKKILDFCPSRIADLNLDPALVEEVRQARINWAYDHGSVDTGKDFHKTNQKLIDQMNEKLIEKINKTVTKRDILYILGDFAFGSIHDAKKLLAKINGQKILVKGNHDRNTRVMLEMGFRDVIENEIIKLNNGKETVKVLVSHFPYFPKGWAKLKTWILIKLGIWKEFDTRYPYKRITDNGMILLHGHTHDKRMINGNMIHVGVESLGGTPISEIELIKIIKGE